MFKTSVGDFFGKFKLLTNFYPSENIQWYFKFTDRFSICKFPLVYLNDRRNFINWKKIVDN